MTLRPFAAALLALAATRAQAQEQPHAADTAAFVVTIGRDTLAVERFTRMADTIRGELVSRSPRTVTRTYRALLTSQGTVRRLEMTSRVPGTTQPPTVANVTFTADSVFTRVQRGDSVFQFRVAARRPFPLVNYSHAFYEQAMIHARVMGGDSTALSIAPIGSNQVFGMVIHPVGADSMRLVNIAGAQRVAADAVGRLLGLDGAESTQKFVVTRLRDIDVAAFAAEFARRDAAQQSMGALSPRDSAVATLGGGRVAVNYGRPFKRGRVIFGGIVPWGEVWRTGANAATGFVATRELVIGGETVPAGRYTLWTLPSQEGWKLIINRQTGQWGTEYDAAQDLVRIDMRTRRLDAAVEAFTIKLEPQGDGAVLRLQWDATEAFVPITLP
jgi:hypothetical protein